MSQSDFNHRYPYPADFAVPDSAWNMDWSQQSTFSIPIVDQVFQEQTPPFMPSSAPESCPPPNSPHQPPLERPMASDEDLNRKYRKARASQACEQCRSRKQRCDEGSPCSFCKSFGLQCNYRPPVPTKFDKVADLMSSWMSSHSDRLENLVDKIEKMEKLLENSGRYDPQRSSPRSSPPRSRVRHEHRSGNCTISACTATAPSEQILLWPQVRQLWTQSGLEVEDNYIAVAEDRPILRLRPHAQDRSDSRFPLKATLPYMPEKSQQSRGRGRKRTPEQSGLESDFTTPAADVSFEKAAGLFAAFRLHFQHMCPFLDYRQLQIQIERISQVGFSDGQSCGARSPKRPCICNESQSDSKFRCMERSPENAIVLLVLALGEVAMHPGPLPSTDDSLAPFTYNSGANGLQLIPGVLYFSEAVSIMGDHIDGSDVAHAQMFLLTGLYKSQLARAREAFTWYATAGRVLTHLVNWRHLYEEGSTTPGPNTDRPYRSPQDDLILRAAWACMHLKGETLSELQLPRGGTLSHLRDTLLLPTEGPDHDTQLACFVYQIRLQGERNRLRRQFSSVNFAQLPLERVNALFKQHAALLQRWRNSLPSSLQWEDADAPSNDAMLATLRYEYYETKLEYLRPFLDYILHIHPGPGQGIELETMLAESNDRQQSTAEMHLLSAVQLLSKSAGESEVVRIAQSCIDAAKQSATAYDGIHGRITVSNIHTVAHKRFGNVLLLAAAQQHPLLSSSFPTKELQYISCATIEFLKQLSPISPTSEADYNILVNIQSNLFGTTQQFLAA